MAVDDEKVQVAIGPAHRCLNDAVQISQRHLAWNTQDPPDARFAAFEPNEQSIGVLGLRFPLLAVLRGIIEIA